MECISCYDFALTVFAQKCKHGFANTSWVFNWSNRVKRGEELHLGPNRPANAWMHCATCGDALVSYTSLEPFAIIVRYAKEHHGPDFA